MLQDGLRRMAPAGIAGHPDWARRRDVHAPCAGPQARRGSCGSAENQGAENEGETGFHTAYSLRLSLFWEGSGRRPLQSIQAQATAVSDPNAPATNPMVRGLANCDAMPAAAIDTIITDQRSDSSVEKTRPRNWSGVWRSSWLLLSTLVTAMPTRENIMQTSAAV